jgi:GNAT superfamily N-acetyltransferase
MSALAHAPADPGAIAVGVAEYVRGERFDEAEIAIAIGDDWQRHGVGTLLLNDLRERAVTAGIRRFTATVLRDNRGALKLVRALGPARTTGQGTVVTPEVELVQSATTSTATFSSSVLPSV